MNFNPQAFEALRQVSQQEGCDLHLHTTASDGLDSPAALLERIEAARLRTFAITDHDTLAAIKPMHELLAQRQKDGKKRIRFIPGVELSVEDQGELHLLAYFPCGGHEKLQPFLRRQRHFRKRRNARLLQRLSDLGYAVDPNVLHAAGEEATGRMQIARALVEDGHVPSIAEAFNRLLAPGRPAYVRREHPPAKEVLAAILAAGGIPVLAHPALYGWCQGSVRVSDVLLARLQALQKLGLLGVEAYHGEAEDSERMEIEAAAAALGLVATAGSDDHGGQRSQLYTLQQRFFDPTTIRVVAALIEGPPRQGRPTYFLARRSTAAHAGLWELPGGKVNGNETLTAALQRELSEELRVAAQIGSLEHVLTYRYPQRRVILTCHAAKTSGDFQLQVHDQSGYFTANEALKLPLLPADVALFEALTPH